MKLITRKTDYALRALCYMAKHRDIVAVGRLVQILGVPRPFMRKILQQLNKAGVLGSIKGQRGGFILRGSPGRIYLVEIMRIFQGRLSLNGCFLKKNVCPNKGKCILRKKLRSIEDEALKRLGKITIASLV